MHADDDSAARGTDTLEYLVAPMEFMEQMSTLVTNLPMIGQPLRDAIAHSKLATLIPTEWYHVTLQSICGPAARRFAVHALKIEPPQLH